MGIIYTILLSFDLIVLDSIDLGNYVNGISFGNGKVWADENYVDYIYKIDPNTMQIIGSFYYSGGLDGLAFDGTYLWIGYYPNQIHKIDTLGNQIGFWQSPGATYSYGMAYDGTYLWHTDKNLKKVYKLDYSNPQNVIAEWNLYFNPRDIEWYQDRFFITSEIPSQRIYVLDTLMNVIDSANTGWRIVSGIGIGGGYLWIGTTAQQGFLYKCDLSTIIKENFSKNNKIELKIFPNPFFRDLNIIFNSKEFIKISLFDLTGKFIKKIYEGKNSSSLISWSAKDIEPGIYILKIETPGYNLNKKIIFMGSR
ncbi:MAG: T9SS type A sorting domain-containing protein [candidate division WOR-3 bacterium]